MKKKVDDFSVDQMFNDNSDIARGTDKYVAEHTGKV